ncbi:type II toxin-antitoxin system VapC family toxin [Planctomicrobium sp. SH661]|uniref:type II toxin-antitoxin system VapC family toxin n=1 Tax=Planctomicrobium sp. SH661 TaxID=3448124 RepID=UPI003F5C19CE
MSPTLILDCSMTMSWCFADEATPQTAAIQDRLISEAVLVPSLWYLEVANVLLMAEKRQRISAQASEEFVQLLGVLEIQVDEGPPRRAFETLMPLCRNHGLTIYDAVYLELAVRQQLPLATLDESLRRAASVLNIPLLGK